jgi:GTP-binding protein
LSSSAVSHQVVLTKAEAIKPSELERRIAETETALKKFAATFPGVIATSSHDGRGIPDLRAAVARLLDERRR